MIPMFRSRPQEFELPPEGITAFESRHADAFEMDQQQHQFHEVFLLLRGKVTVTAEHVERTMDPGDYFVVPAGVPHYLQDERASTLVIVAFSQDAIHGFPGRELVWNEIRQRATPDHRVFSAGSTVYAGEGWRTLVAMAYRPVARIELEIAFSRFLIELQSVTRQPREVGALKRVQQLHEEIGERVYEPWSLDRAAAATNLSRRRFSELWRQCSGESFVADLQQMRISCAQSLMRDQSLSVAAAAYAAGFNDLANFYRVFRRAIGCPPRQWLEKIRA